MSYKQLIKYILNILQNFHNLNVKVSMSNIVLIKKSITPLESSLNM